MTAILAQRMSGRNHDYTFKIAEQAIERIKALALPADPPAFELWYTYVTGVNEKLNQRINRIIEDNGQISTEELANIEDEFLSLAQLSSNVGNVGTKISTEVDNVVNMLGELILATSRGRGDFADASRKLANPIDLKAVRTISDALIETLRTIEMHHAALEKRLIASKSEIEAAHESLARVTLQANLDPVTGLANRRGFDGALEQTVERANKEDRRLCLLMLDIDHFKSFNDRFGHLTGDTVLRLISVTLRQSIRAQDIAARYGGEEFAVILLDTDLKEAVTCAETIRTKIMSRALRKRSTGDNLGVITVSIGIAAFRAGERSREIIERADSCLYEAKRSGRNCTRYEDFSDEFGSSC